MSDLPLLDWTPPVPFDGKGDTFVVGRDGKRLGAQCQRVYDAMRAGEWWLLHDLASACDAPEASVSARLRDLRRYGFKIEREYITGGLWRYRMRRE
jgi:hypothetical protein